jgi:two-component system osmolarity sensor histidine kinase EnvZ
MLPRSLFGRALLIILLPTLIMLTAATYVFFDRHWATVTNRMATGIAGDVAATVTLLQDTDSPAMKLAIARVAADKMDLNVGFVAGGRMAEGAAHAGYSPLAVILKRALEERLNLPFAIDAGITPEVIRIRVQVREGVYTILTPERRIYTPTTQVFILWMAGSAILLSGVALIFMRNQIRPVRRLAEAAEAIGKGREVPWFKLEGAAEVRQAGAALMVMRDRLRRQIGQRTAMLAGVSHDLRTPLTRMKLQLALMPANAETAELTADITEMEIMLDAYLAFARGEEGEAAAPADLAALLREIASAAQRQHPDIRLDMPDEAIVTLRRNAMKRCIGNLLGNALRYGKRAEVHLSLRDHIAEIIIDDDGPGIPQAQREDMFRPFTRLEGSRNPATGGVGLGLTIARDIARVHGGDVMLEDSPLGGLRSRIWLPV